MGKNRLFKILLLLVLLGASDVSLPPVQVVEGRVEIQEIQ